MNRYVVGFMSLFDGELLLEQVEASSGLEAMKMYLEDPMYASMTEDELYASIYDQDCYINWIMI